MTEYVVPFTELGMHDVERVGGKNASLGEMISHLSRLGISVPAGFATTAAAYREFLAHDGLAQRIEAELSRLNVDDVAQLARTGDEIRSWVAGDALSRRHSSSSWWRPGSNWAAMQSRSRYAPRRPRRTCRTRRSPASRKPSSTCAARTICCSATHQVFASLFNDRAIAYRVHHGFAHAQVALSAGVQLMVRSDLGASGVMFTLDTESGFRDVVFITASYGLG